MIMANHFPNDPYPPSVPIRGNLDARPLIVETYSRVGLRGKRYYWRVKHKSNGEPMAAGEPYSTAAARDHAVDVLWPDLSVDSLG
jgi:hypothetical protein